MLGENKKLARRLIEDGWNKSDLTSLSESVTADVKLHDAVFPGLAPGTESLKRHISMYRNAFPDLHFAIDDTIAERNEVVIHWTATGTHKGDFLGIAPTDKVATVSGTSILRFIRGKVAEYWTDWNLLALTQQLGIAVMQNVKLPQ